MKITLGTWDFELIRHCKTLAPTLQGAREIWGWRNACEPDDVNLYYLTKRMMEFIELDVDEIMEIIKKSQPQEMWKFSTAKNPINKDELDFLERLYHVLSSRIALTKVSELPGYAEWLDSQKSRVLP